MQKNSNKVALITGAFGQDGKLLKSLLLKEKYNIIEIGSKRSLYNDTEINHYNILNEKDVKKLLSEYSIDEIYYLAAKVLSTESRNRDEDLSNSFIKNFDINVNSYHFFLKNIKQETKIFYPASSYMFQSKDGMINEKSKISPTNLYSINKSTSYWLSKYYREKYNLFISVGFLFNHESLYRDSTYISKKIILQAKEIKSGERDSFNVYNENQLVDWGHAEDYVKAMYLIMQHKISDDFIISSGELNSVKDFIKIVCQKMNINFEERMVISKDKQTSLPYYFGDNKKILNTINWKPEKKLTDIIEDMI